MTGLKQLKKQHVLVQLEMYPAHRKSSGMAGMQVPCPLIDLILQMLELLNRDHVFVLLNHGKTQ